MMNGDYWPLEFFEGSCWQQGETLYVTFCSVLNCIKSYIDCIR